VYLKKEKERRSSPSIAVKEANGYLLFPGSSENKQKIKDLRGTAVLYKRIKK